MSTRQNVFWVGLVILLFLGALFWAKEQDPFSRKWFTLKTADHGSTECVAVLPKPMRRYPVVIYAHGSGGSLMNDGKVLRQMAELGLAIVGLEYNRTNEAVFAAQLGTLLQHLSRQSWVNTNAIAWVGFSLGANRMLDFAAQHPEPQPRLLVQLSGRGIDQSTLPPSLGSGTASNAQPLANLHCPVLFVHGERDEAFPVADTKRLAAVLQTRNLPVELKTIPDASHSLEPEREAIFRAVGEYCLTHLAGAAAWQNYRSISQWQAEAPPLWRFWLPAVIWASGWLIWHRRSRPAKQAKTKLNRREIALRWVAILLGTAALAITGIHLITPHFAVSDTTLTMARRFLVQPKERADFEYLAAQPLWHTQKLKTLLEHVELAGYNRELVNWQLADKVYRDFVLSPVVTGNSGEPLSWRRPLWEEFYPRIRHENSPEDAAKIVVRYLRGRVTIAALPNLPHDVLAIWLKQITDETGFEIIYVAALRSVGVPARLNPQTQAEFWDGTVWRVAPQPPAGSWWNSA